MRTDQEIKDGKAKHFKGDAHMAVIIKPIQHLDAETKDKIKKERKTQGKTNFRFPDERYQTL